MHNIKLLRENTKDFKKKLSNRNFDFNEKEFETLDKNNRKLISQKEKLEQEKKILLEEFVFFFLLILISIFLCSLSFIYSFIYFRSYY